MRAAAYHQYGAPDVLTLRELPTPKPRDHEVLIRVRAAALNPMDYHLMRGIYAFRLTSGIRAPQLTIPGADVAGVVEAIGARVTKFRPGEAVFGHASGSLAEFSCAVEDRVIALPANVPFVEAAAVPVAAITALQGLRDRGRVRAGQRVLINGASGGVGTFAVQLAAAFGAHVTGVCSRGNVALVRSLGAADVIDYERDDFTQGESRYDVVLDCVGNRPFSSVRRVMTPRGILVLVGAPPGGAWAGPLPTLLRGVWSSWFASQRAVLFVASPRADDLLLLRQFLETGRVRAVVDRVYPLDEAPDALRYLQQAHARGKVVVLGSAASDSSR